MNASEWNDPLHIENLTAFDFAVFGFMIRIGKEFTDGGDARATMSLMDRSDWIKAVPTGPPRPNPRHRGRGIHQNSIHVKQDRFAGNFRHR